MRVCVIFFFLLTIFLLTIPLCSFSNAHTSIFHFSNFSCSFIFQGCARRVPRERTHLEEEASFPRGRISSRSSSDRNATALTVTEPAPTTSFALIHFPPQDEERTLYLYMMCLRAHVKIQCHYSCMHMYMYSWCIICSTFPQAAGTSTVTGATSGLHLPMGSSSIRGTTRSTTASTPS